MGKMTRVGIVEQPTLDTVIVGGGAAGLSAALMLGRARRRLAICDDNRPRNAVAHQMHGFLTREGMSPSEFLAIAREQLERYSAVQQIRAHVIDVHRSDGGFAVATQSGETLHARTILLAPGLYDELPPIEGLRELWGGTAFVCPYCDGWEVADKRIAIVGDGRPAVQLAQELRQWSADLLLCVQHDDELKTDDRRWLSAVHAEVRREAIAGFHPNDNGAIINFADGSQETCEAIFLTAPLRQRYPLVETLAVKVGRNGAIDVDGNGRTNVAGCYAAGDAVTAVHQVTMACASGVSAAMAINEDLTRQDVRNALSGTFA